MDRLSYFRPDLVATGTGTLAVDLCIYGANAAGVMAAVQAVRSGLSVALLEPSDHVGGLTAGGLGWTDVGRKQAIGGLSRDFYRRLGRHYGVEEQYAVEPSVAERTLLAYLAEVDVRPRFRQYLAGLDRDGQRIVALRTLGGLAVRAAQFIDCTYEGDLMAAAGVPYVVGRESNDLYGESRNGVQVHEQHQFDRPVDPYRVPGMASSGLLPGIDPSPLGPIGSGDRRVQAYTFRMCLTDVAANRIPFRRPEGYDALDYELLARHLQAGWDEVFAKFDRLPNGKTDTNNHGAQSTDFIGANHAYPTAGYEQRERIFQAHVRYQQGLQWFLANETAVPEGIRTRYAAWGLPKDEFTATGGWPHQLYVREARRMVSDYVLTEADCSRGRSAPDSIGMGAYGMDSHNCRRFVIDGRVRNEGDVQQWQSVAPYPISYRSIVPGRGYAPNLLVPVCCAASHIAYGSVRMEPVFMILGQSAAIAAQLAIRGGTPVQDVAYPALRQRLAEAGQVLELHGEAAARHG